MSGGNYKGVLAVRILLVVVVCMPLTDGLSLSWLGLSRDHPVRQSSQVIGTYYNLRDSLTPVSRSRRQSTDTTPATIQALHIVSRVTSRFSETAVTSVVDNPTQDQKEAMFNLEIPQKAFISNFSMIIDGQVIVTQVKSKQEADDLYEAARRKNQTAGRVTSTQPSGAQKPQRGMERFTVSIMVKASSSIEFELTYLQLLERSNGLYEQIISMRPGQIVPDFRVDVYVYDKQGVTDLSISEPTLNTSSLEYQIARVVEVSTVLQHVSFHPTPEQQSQMDPQLGVNRELIVSYDVVHPDDGGLLEVENGNHFAHYFSPREDQYAALDKHIVFVLDTSGSMKGHKMTQTRIAFKTIIAQLRENDTFLIMLFDSVVEYWPSWNEPVRASKKNIQDAIKFAEEKLVAQGGTNIVEAITTACDILRRQNNSAGSNLVMFMTDGQPTEGEKNPDRIVARTVDAAANQVVIFSLAFGFEVDFGLLEKLAYRTGGGVKRIYEGSDAAQQLTEFYDTIGTPLMYDIQVSYPVNMVRASSLTGTRFNQFFKGSELVIVGQLVDNIQDVTVLTATVTAAARRDSATISTISLTAESSMDVTEDELPTEVANQQGFIEKLYVYLRIKHLLKEKLLTDDLVKQVELEAEALELALEYRLVTPLTSMIIVQPDGRLEDSGQTRESTLSGSSHQVYAPESRLSGILGLLVYVILVYHVQL